MMDNKIGTHAKLFCTPFRGALYAYIVLSDVLRRPVWTFQAARYISMEVPTTTKEACHARPRSVALLMSREVSQSLQ